MSTTRSPDGAIVIEISDRGVGMADDELADANMRLVGPSGVDVSASRRMGLFVVGRLAARHGIGVRLSSTAAGPGSGLTASVSVPPSLIPTGVPADAPRPAGVPMPAGVPAQGRPAEARPTWPDANGARPTPLSALVTGADAPGNAPSAAREASPTGGQGTLFPGKPPVNGNTTHGLPTRRPGSSLRPDGPPPTEAPPGGFFDDGGHGEGGERARGRPRRGRPAARPASRPGSTRRPPPAATAWPGGRGSPPCRRPTRRATTNGRFPTTSGRRRTKVPPTGRGSPRTSPSPAIARVRAAPHPPAPEVRTPTTTPRGRRRPTARAVRRQPGGRASAGASRRRRHARRRSRPGRRGRAAHRDPDAAGRPRGLGAAARRGEGRGLGRAARADTGRADPTGPAPPQAAARPAAGRPAAGPPPAGRPAGGRHGDRSRHRPQASSAGATSQAHRGPHRGTSGRASPTTAGPATAARQSTARQRPPRATGGPGAAQSGAGTARPGGLPARALPAARRRRPGACAGPGGPAGQGSPAGPAGASRTGWPRTGGRGWAAGWHRGSPPAQVRRVRQAYRCGTRRGAPAARRGHPFRWAAADPGRPVHRRPHAVVGPRRPVHRRSRALGAGRPGGRRAGRIPGRAPG